MGHFAGFIFYTLAMTGIFFIGMIVAKNSLSGGFVKNSRKNFLNIESSLSLEPRKNLYVIKAGNERMLISTDSEGSHFLAKLDSNNIPVEIEEAKIKQPYDKNAFIQTTKEVLLSKLTF